MLLIKYNGIYLNCALIISLQSAKDGEGIYTQIRDRINAYPDSRCTESQSVERVASSRFNVSPKVCLSIYRIEAKQKSRALSFFF